MHVCISVYGSFIYKKWYSENMKEGRAQLYSERGFICFISWALYYYKYTYVWLNYFEALYMFVSDTASIYGSYNI